MATKKIEPTQNSEVRIAVANVNSELSFESPSTQVEISTAVSAAIASGSPLILSDIRGRTIMVPAEKIGFVEIGAQTERRVGFGSL
jgi:hypothetical protein